MHGGVKALRVQATVSFSLLSKFTLWWQENSAECPNSDQSSDNDGCKIEVLHFFVVFAPAVLHKLILFYHFRQINKVLYLLVQLIKRSGNPSLRGVSWGAEAQKSVHSGSPHPSLS